MAVGQQSEAQDTGVVKNLAIPGAITYMHMPSLDAQQSADFYEAVFGWEIVSDNRDAFEDRSGRLRGAWSTSHEVAETDGMIIYIYVEDVDAALGQVVAHGGQVVEPTFKEMQLDVAKFRDPSGNLLGLWHRPDAE